MRYFFFDMFLALYTEKPTWTPSVRSSKFPTHFSTRTFLFFHVSKSKGARNTNVAHYVLNCASTESHSTDSYHRECARDLGAVTFVTVGFTVSGQHYSGSDCAVDDDLCVYSARVQCFLPNHLDAHTSPIGLTVSRALRPQHRTG